MTGAPVRDELRDLARLMAAFHTHAGRGPGIAVDGAAAALRGRWQANVAELAGYRGALLPDGLVDEIDRLATRFVDGRGDLLTRRYVDRRVVDGHGDLTPTTCSASPTGRGCWTASTSTTTCATSTSSTTSRSWRWIWNGWAAPTWARPSSTPTPSSPAIPPPRPFATTTSPTARSCGPRWRVFATTRPERALTPASRSGTASCRAITCVEERAAGVGRRTSRNGEVHDCGWLGRPLRSRAAVLDRMRKELAGLDPAEAATAGFREGLYSTDRTEALYRRLLHRAERLLAQGESVVLDASWTARHHEQPLSHWPRGRRATSSRSSAVPLLRWPRSASAIAAPPRRTPPLP